MPRFSYGSKSTKSPARSALHLQVANILREKIYKREWVSGQRIPSENELVKSFGISRGTVRKALAALIEEGLLKSIHGSGTFVEDHAISHPAGERPISFAKSLRKQGKRFTTLVQEKRLLDASAEVSAKLQIPLGDPAMFMRRIRLVDDEPVMCQEGFYSLRICPGIDAVDFTVESAFDAVQNCSGRKVQTSHMRYVARVAGKEHGDYLDVDATAPVLLLEQTILLNDGTPIEWSYTWFKAGQEIVGVATQEQ
ncbi:GntR family transcriptional regulator [Atopobium fossor]|uniref:GntR family transcriptional regulator n=1 Tax=Atopobium fossor TaxID=39487 RepID=UPI000425AFCB|nr:GntR family transcriptional regulator [Atopobium fossor]